MASPVDALLARPAHERRLGPYLLEAPLGRGGFAPVWKAREVYAETEVRTVALKVFPLDPDTRRAGSRPLAPTPRVTPLTPSVGPSSAHHNRVIQEARSLCQVEHPHVVRFYTLHVDEAAGLLGLVMEFLPGRSLDQRLRDQGPMEPPDVLALGRQLASALVAVHAAGLVHRDLKPANVIEARTGYKLIDFGIAASEAPPARPAAKRVVLDDLPFELVGTRASQLTGAATLEGTVRDGPVAGLASGTVGYMDPHAVATGAPATAASDLYGLGVVLFEALTGKLPATATSQGLRGEVLDGRASPPPLASIAPAVPPALASLVDALLAPDPTARPASAAAVEAALTALAAPEPSPSVAPPSVAPPSASPPAASPPAPPSGASGRSWLVPLTALVTVAAVALGARQLTQRAPCVPGDGTACAARCDVGEATSCHTLGLMYERAAGVPKDETRAAGLFEKSCQAGVGAACHALGAMREQGRGGPRDEVAARQRYEEACTAGDAQGCNALAIQLAAGVGGAADLPRAAQLYERACERGYPNACANLGVLHERGTGVTRDETRARTLYERACTEGASSSCGLLAMALLAGRGGPAEPKRAVPLLERSCTAGASFACVGLGVLLYQGDPEHRPDHDRAARLYQQACEDGERQGCFYLAQLHQRGDGVPSDEVRAFVLFQRACELGHSGACRMAGEASATGRGVQRDDTRAVGFFKKSCAPASPGEALDPEGCAWLAVHLREGRGIDRSPDEAEKLRQRACSLGALLGCSP